MGQCISSCKLRSKKHKGIPLFTFEKIKTRARVCNVHSGNVITVLFLYKNIYVKKHFKIEGYNCPRSCAYKVTADTPLTDECDKIARGYLSNKILNRIVHIQISKEENGNLIGTVEFNGMDMSNYMISNSMGIPTEDKFTTEKLLKIRHSITM